MKEALRAVTKNARETEKFAEAFAREVLRLKTKRAILIGLEGELGVGKTTFAKGFARGLGIKEEMKSPTFILMRVFRAKKRNFFHIDAYRDQLDFREFLKDRNKILLLLDMHAILHRSFHALPAFSSQKGEPTGALYVLVTFLFKAIRELKPDYIAAGYDLPEPTFRHAAYDKYKEQRPEPVSDLVMQIKRSYDILNALGIKYFEHAKFEADDVIGTLAEKAKSIKDLEIIVASGDMDTLQLVKGTKIRVFTLKKGINDTIIYNEEKVRERFGFGPELLADYKGLRGDPSDNIPGIPGIGEKGASELILKFGNLEKIFKAIKKDRGELIKKGIKERTVKLLEEHEEEALFSRELGTIRRDVPLDFDLEKLKWKNGYDDKKVT